MITSEKDTIKEQNRDEGGLDRWLSGLRALAPLKEDPGLVPSIYMVICNHLQLHFKGTCQLFLASEGTAYVCCRDILAGKTPTHIK